MLRAPNLHIHVTRSQDDLARATLGRGTEPRDATDVAGGITDDDERRRAPRRRGVMAGLNARPLPPDDGPPAFPTPRHDRGAPGHGRAAGIAERLGSQPRTVDDLTRREGAVGLATGRVALLVACAIAAATSPDSHPGAWAVVLLGVLWITATDLQIYRGVGLRVPLLACVLVDALLIAVGFPATGGATSHLAYTLAAMPPVLSLVFTARQTVAVSAVPYLGYAACAVPGILDGEPGTLRTATIVTVAYAAGAIIAAICCTTRDRAAARTRELYALRRGLLAQALAAEERASRRLSEALHDHALQTLLAASQDLEEVRTDDDSRTTLLHARRNLADGVADLRRTVRQMHPITLSSGGLAGAIARLTHEHAQRAGFEVVIDVDEEACGLQDELVFSLVRELVTNAAKHADADQVVVRLETTGRWVDLEVIDDGAGMTDDRQQAAVDSGHIGLASTRERVEAAGGWMSIESGRGSGTAVRVRLPV